MSYLVTAMNGAIIITGLPRMAEELELSLSALSWVQNIYVLAWGSFMLMGGRISDLLGRKSMLVLSLSLFGGGTLWSGLSASAFGLIASRFVQGLGAAILAPTSLALIMDHFDGQNQVRVVSWYSSISGLGMCIGLIIGGVLTESYSWRLGFFSYLPIIGCMIYLAHITLKRKSKSVLSLTEIDITGTLLSTSGIFSLVYAINGAQTPWVWGGAGTVLLGLFIYAESKSAAPIMPLHLFDGVRSRAHLARVLFAGAMMGYYFFISEFLQETMAYSALEVGWAFLPLTLSTFVAAVQVPRVVARWGNKWALAFGLTLMVAGFYCMTGLSVGCDYWSGIAFPMLLLGVGQGLVMSPLTNLAVIGVSQEDAGSVSGIVNATHQIGCSVGLSIMVAASSQCNGLAEICRQAMKCGLAFILIAFVLTMASKRNIQKLSTIWKQLH